MASTFAEAVPILVNDNVLLSVCPTATAPKFNEVGLALSSALPGEIPLPATGRLTSGSVAVLFILICEEKSIAWFGLNSTWKVIELLWSMQKGTGGTPLTLNRAEFSE